jgi:hypothetical protein
MSRSLDDLTPEMRPIAMELLARCIEKRIQVIIIDTLRTPEEQEQNVRNGVSWTRNSKHLPQEPSGKSDAIDIAPVKVLHLKNWAPNHPDWRAIGNIGEDLGLAWGGRWSIPDCSHFQRN